MSLSNNFEDILSDCTLMESSIITLSETWLEEKTKLDIKGYRAHFNSVGAGKGIAVYTKNNNFKATTDIKEEKCNLLN